MNILLSIEIEIMKIIYLITAEELWTLQGLTRAYSFLQVPSRFFSLLLQLFVILFSKDSAPFLLIVAHAFCTQDTLMCVTVYSSSPNLRVLRSLPWHHTFSLQTSRSASHSKKTSNFGEHFSFYHRFITLSLACTKKVPLHAENSHVK